MDIFFVGFLVGLMCGGTLGVLLMAVFVAGARADLHERRD